MKYRFLHTAWARAILFGFIFFSCISLDQAASKAQAAQAQTTAEQPDLTGFDDISFEEPTIVIVEAPKETKAGEPVSSEVTLPIEVPVLGTIDMVLDDSGDFKARYPSQGKPWSLGFLTISDGEFVMGKTKDQEKKDTFRYTAKATMFGKAARVGLRDFVQGAPRPEEKGKTFSRVTLGIEFSPSKPKLTLIPGVPFAIDSADVILEKNKPIDFVITGAIGGQNVALTLTMGKEAIDGKVELSNLKLQSIIPQLSGTPLSSAMISTGSLTIENLIKKKSAKALTAQEKKKLAAKYTLEARVDMSGTLAVVGAQESSEKKKSSFEITVTGQAGNVSVHAALASLKIPGFGTLENAVLAAEVVDGKKSVELSGDAQISLMGNTYKLNVGAQLAKGDIVFSGKIDPSQTVSVADVVINNGVISFSTKEKKISLSGDADIFDRKTKVLLSFDPKGGFEGKAEIVTGKEKPIRPFASLNIPVVKEIELREPYVRFVKAADGSLELALHGNVQIYVPIEGDLFVRKTGNKTIYLLKAQAPKNFKLSDGMKELKGTLFDNITLNQFNFVVSSDDYDEQVKKGVEKTEGTNPDVFKYHKGLNFVAQATLSGPLAPAGKLLNEDGSVITIIASLDPSNPLNSVFRADVPSGIVMKNDQATLDKFSLEIKGNPTPALALLTQMHIKPSSHDDWLVFTIRIGVSALDAMLAGTLRCEGEEGGDCYWHNPVGIKGLDIAYVALQGGINYVKFAATGLPSNFGIAGSMKINDKIVMVATNIDTGDPNKFMIAGAVEQLTLHDIIVVAQKLTTGAFKEVSLPEADVALEDVSVYMVPQDKVMIGEIEFNQGFSLSGRLRLGKLFEAGVEGRLISGLAGGAFFTGYCSPINIANVLKITRSKKDKEGRLTDTDWQKLNTDVAKTTVNLATANETANQLAKDAAVQIDSKKQKELVKAKQAVFDAQRESVRAQATLRRAYATSNGPYLDLRASLQEQRFKISGRFEIVDIFSQDSFLEIGNKGIHFAFDTVLGDAIFNGVPILQAYIEAASSGKISNPDFEVTIKFANNVNNLIQDKIKEGLSYIKDQMKTGVSQAQDEIRKLDAVIADGKAKVEAASRDVENAKSALKALDKAQHDIDQALQDQQDKVNSLQHQIDDMQNRIDNAKRDFEDKPLWAKILYGWAQAGGEITGYGTALAGLVAAKEVANGVLEGLKQIGKGSVKAAQETARGTLTATKGFLDTVGKGVVEGSLLGARGSGIGLLTATREAAGALLEAGKIWTSISFAFIMPVNISGLSYHGSLQELATGKLGNVECEVRFLGGLLGDIGKLGSVFSPLDKDQFRTTKIHFTLDIRSPLESLNKVANEAVDLVSVQAKAQQEAYKKLEADAQKAIDQIKSWQAGTLPAGGLSAADQALLQKAKTMDIEQLKAELIKQAQEAEIKALGDKIARAKLRKNLKVFIGELSMLAEAQKTGNKQKIQELGQAIQDDFKSVQEFLTTSGVKADKPEDVGRVLQLLSQS